MRLSVMRPRYLGMAALAVLGGAFLACSDGGGNKVVNQGAGGTGDTGGEGGSGGTGGRAGSGGTGGRAGSGGSGGSMGGSGGSMGGSGGSMGGSGGSMGGEGGAMGGSGGMGGSMGGTGGMAGTIGTAPDAGTEPVTDWMGYAGIADLSQVKKTPGCGMMTTQATGSWVGFTTAVPIPMGHDGPGGDGMRRYFVKLPPNYDPNKPYKLVIGGSSCVPQQTNPAPIDFAGVTNPSGGVIQVSPIVEPGVMAEGNYVCYDDKDTKSIEYPFIEKFLKEVGEKFCYDQNKVFVQGHSSGGWYANMMGCVYGSTLIRAMSSNGGGIARGGPPITPPCHPTNPTPGMWILPTGDTEGRPDTADAINRALKNNKCEGGDGANAFMTAPSDPYTMGGGVACKKYRCPAAFPVVYCTPGGGHGNVGWHASAAWAFFNAIP